jgi:hypothetical protein
VNEEYRQAMEAEIKTKLAAQAEGPVASPSVPYTKYILMDDERAPPGFPPELSKTIYDRELCLTFLDEWKQNWLLQQHMRAENLFTQGCPVMSATHRRAIVQSSFPAKLMIKLSRSSIPRSQQVITNERILQAAQIISKLIATSLGTPPAVGGSRWRIFGKKKEVVPSE